MAGMHWVFEAEDRFREARQNLYTAMVLKYDHEKIVAAIDAMIEARIDAKLAMRDCE